MKKVLFLALLTTVIAASPAAAATYTASQILDKAVEAMRNAPSLNILMTIQEGNNGSYNAALTIAGDKFKYEFGTLSVLFDGKTQWTVDKGQKEVSVTEPTVDEIAESNPLAFVSNYKKNYTAKLVSRSNGNYTVSLTALKKSSYVRSAQIVVNEATWMPVSVSAVLSTGQKLFINVVSITRGKTMPTADFRFDIKKNTGFEIIDLR